LAIYLGSAIIGSVAVEGEEATFYGFQGIFLTLKFFVSIERFR